MTEPGATDQTEYFAIVDSSGSALTGLDTTDITSASYVRDRGLRVAITPAILATPAPDDVHLDGGFIEVDATQMAGIYRFDIPDAAFATGADEVTIYLRFTGGSGAQNAALRIRLESIWDQTRSNHEASGSFGEVHMPVASGTILGTPTPTGTTFKTTIDVPNDDIYNGAVLVLLTGTRIRASRRITFSDGDDTLFMDEAFIPTPVASDRVLLIPQSYFENVINDVLGNVNGGVGSLSAQAKLDVNAEVDVALNTAIPGSPTADSINERIKTLDDNYTTARAALLDNLDAAVSSRSDFDETANPVELLDSGGAAGTSASELVDDIFDEPKAGHAVADSFGELFAGRVTGKVTDTSPSAGDFEIDLLLDNVAFDNHVCRFITGALAGQARRIQLYTGGGSPNKIEVTPAFTTAPATDDRFEIIPIPLDVTLDANEQAALTSVIFNKIIEGTFDFQETMRILLSAQAGETEGGGTPTFKIKAASDTGKTRVQATVTADGDRSGIVTDVTP